MRMDISFISSSFTKRNIVTPYQHCFPEPAELHPACSSSKRSTLRGFLVYIYPVAPPLAQMAGDKTMNVLPKF